MERLIFHIDVNSAFLSWEAVRRLQAGDKQDLRLLPSAIGGDREKRTGVILAKSIPAKAYGVQTGEPIAQALRKCPTLILAKPDFALYEKSSKAFLSICRKYAPVVEQYSIDECFLDMSGTSMLYPDPIAIAHRIKDEIRDTLGFTVNVGIGSNKLLAKMASDFEKPDRVHTLYSEEIEAKMHPLDVGALFTVGASTAEKLRRSYVRTIGDLARTDPIELQNLLGNKQGTHLHQYANGIDDSPVQAEAEDAKGYSISTTLPQDLTDWEAGNRVLLALTDSVASRMRADRAKAYCIAVTVRSNQFKDRSHQRKLSTPTDITDEIYAIVKSLFAELWDGRTPLRLLGVALTEVCREGEEMQLSLFSEDAEKEKARRVDRAVDAIRNRFGYNTIKRGASCDPSERIGRKSRTKQE
ncbi:MAG: DNA polymerase IV [Clostridia bacterium]|nr:DNA polymerase IV [Clostridia bacterium]MBQ1962690.1 DNA polymerase IV [Clostridia bacterium]